MDDLAEVVKRSAAKPVQRYRILMLGSQVI
jgi:hypothetical protein